MQALSIPIYTTLGSDEGGGTAFLGSLRGELYLITVAHAFTGLTSSSTQWDSWASAMNAYVIDSIGQVTDLRIEIFDTDQFGERVPRFMYVNSPHVSGHILDAIMLPVSPEWGWVENYTITSLDITSTPKVGDGIRAQGYPIQPIWPEIQQTSGRIVEVPFPVPGLLLADMPVQVGYSGAAATDDKGEFLGLVAGHTVNADKFAQIIPRGFLRRAKPSPGGSLLNPLATSF